MVLATFLFFHLSLSSALRPIPCFDYKKDSVLVEWTGYKYTEKTGVKGKLKKVTSKYSGTPQSIEELIKSTSFVADTLSVDSGDAARDMNLRDHFFKLMSSPQITGKVLSVDKGKAQVQLTMNGVTKTVPFNLDINGSSIKALGEIDILDFSMSSSLKKINEICYELHKGKDGVSKTWSQVNLSISAEALSLCNKKGK